MTRQPSWQHQVRVEQDRAVVVLAGEIDINGVVELRGVLETTIRAGQPVYVDLEAVGFIDSTVISALIDARNTAIDAGTDFAVINPTRHVARTLHITGVLKVLAPTRA
jgi:anti-anti-sigma factor